MARASSSVNRISGSIAPSAAAAIGLVGISDVSHDPKPGAWPLEAICPAASAAPAGSGGRVPMFRGSIENTRVATGISTMAVPDNSSTKVSSVRPPIRPMREDRPPTPHR